MPLVYVWFHSDTTMPTLKWAPLGKSDDLYALRLLPAVAIYFASDVAKPVALAA